MALQTPSRPTAAERAVRSGEDHASASRIIVSVAAMVAMLAAGFLLGRYLAPSPAQPPAAPTAAAEPEAAPLTQTRREVLPHPRAVLPAAVSLSEPNANVREGRVVAAAGGGLQSAREPAANLREDRFAPHTAVVLVREANANLREGRVGAAAGSGVQSGYADTSTLSRHFGHGTGTGPISHSRLGPVHRTAP